MIIPRSIKLALTLAVVALSLASCGSPQQKEAAYIKRGNELLDQGEYDKARVEYKNAARIMPADPEVAYRFGLLDEATGDFHAAFGDFTRAVQQDAHFHPAIIKLAEYYLAAEQYDQVQNRIDEVLADTPDDADAHAMHAALDLRQKDFENAEKEARLALAKDPNNVTAFSALSGIYTAQGNQAKAVATIEDGIGRNPKNLSLLILRAGMAEHSGDPAKTAAAYDAIFKLKPKDVRYRLDLANTYIKADKLDDAEAALRAGVAALPDDWSMKYQLVTFLGDHRGVDAAEKEIRGYMQAHPNNADLNGWLTDLYLAHNETARAVDFLGGIIASHQYDRQGLDARTALARLDYIKSDRDATSKLVAEVLQNDPNNLDARFLKAHLEYDDGFYQNAVIDLRAIVRDRPKAKEALKLLAETFLILGPSRSRDRHAQSGDRRRPARFCRAGAPSADVLPERRFQTCDGSAVPRHQNRTEIRHWLGSDGAHRHRRQKLVDGRGGDQDA